MKVKSLLNKDFENINSKKVDIATRHKMIKRKIQSLSHQLAVLAHKQATFLQKLVDTGVAYTADDERYNRFPSHFSLGALDRKTLNINHTPENKVIFDYVATLGCRESVVRGKLMDLRKTLKGLESAITRKEREKARQARFDASRGIFKVGIK